MTTSRKLVGGRKKGNGHKMNCGCPICKNMRKSKKRGGADEDNVAIAEIADDDDDLWDIDGGKRTRKHKKGSRRTRKHRKHRR